MEVVEEDVEELSSVDEVEALSEGGGPRCGGGPCGRAVPDEPSAADALLDGDRLLVDVEPLAEPRSPASVVSTLSSCLRSEASVEDEVESVASVDADAIDEDEVESVVDASGGGPGGRPGGGPPAPWISPACPSEPESLLVSVPPA